ncbi:peptidoglycan-binding protein [Alkalihalobacillus trypoxylicola]|uniref:Peptidoglycan-binding protein n=1 Tax=Alkalihalobacillus trypoxylicola TaxID=519424 RepID=A0A162F6D4_9BACI|nr:peptidoglycan-binding protein [Alkalihalobacillus trypoxylicola]KYG34888.1 peptidoglycan-binding protein [Alkalihalobacillus trypoxylicola]
MMKTNKATAIRNLGLPIVAAGAILFFTPSHAGAEKLEDNVLLKGMDGDQIEELQEKLFEDGFLDKEAIHGSYDNDTKEAVKSFQKEHQLYIDGIAGPQTMGAIMVLEEGDDGIYVKALQKILGDFDYYDGEITGDFDNETKNAVKKAQKDLQITVDGIAGPDTFGSLYNGVYNTEETLESSENKEVAPVATSQPNNNESSESDNADGTVLTMEATAYTAECEGCSGITATGIDLLADRNKKVIAVDPSVIPLGTRVHVEGYGEAIAGDTGGAIKGNKVDLHVPTKNEAIQFGRQNVKVTILD